MLSGGKVSAGFEIVGLSVACVLLAVTMVGPVVAQQITPIFGITIDTTLLVLYFFVFSTVYNAVLLASIMLQDRKKVIEREEDQQHLFTIMIPCRNEGTVIEETVNSLMKIDYPKERFEVLAINDGSTDQTPQILKKLANEYPNLKTLDVPYKESGQGKSAVLNKGFSHLQKTSSFSNNPNWIIGVFDADGYPDTNILSKASHGFQNKKVGAVQVLVRINNSKSSILPMLQDIEFLTFAKVTQTARSIFKGAVALGGNGQFVRAKALETVRLTEDQYWHNEALTEDLDLGTRLLFAGWENSFISNTAIWQHGVTTLGALYKQRTRWSWGALQCFFRYVFTFEVAKHKISLTKKFDMLFYLSATLVPPLILLVWALSIISIAGLLPVTTPFPMYFLIANGISFFPLIGYGLWTARREYKIRYIIPLIFLTTAYTYHWVVCTLTAMSKIITRKKPKWIVTYKQPPPNRIGNIPKIPPKGFTIGRQTENA